MKPILFNTEMVKAILDGRKTATRRIVKSQPNGIGVEKAYLRPDGNYIWTICRGVGVGKLFSTPYKVGDILYVRETWKVSSALVGRESSCEVEYRAGGSEKFNRIISIPSVKWHPSLHMPKEAARIFLKVTGVRVERLKEIDEVGAKSEGFKDKSYFMSKFCEIYETDIYENPWVWVIEFERCEREAE